MPKGEYVRLARNVKLHFDIVTAARLTRAAEQDGTTPAAMLTEWVQHNIDAMDPAGASRPAEDQ